MTSPDIKAGQRVKPDTYWNGFGCTGKNLMPALEWGNAPQQTKSFVASFYDQDAPSGSEFWHWVVYDIPSATTKLPGWIDAGTLPTGAVQGNTDLGKPGFFVPCPPTGRRHRYVYIVSALKVDKLEVDKGASPALVGFVLWQNTLAKATLQVHAGP